VYADAQAGPYHLSIVVRPPQVIPGVADLEVRALTPGVAGITIAPVPLTGEASKHPPVADAMQKPSADGQFYNGHLWIMATGSWQIRFVVTGAQGQGVVSIPVAAAATGTQTMQRGMGAMLAGLGTLLLIGMIGIVGAAAREAKLAPGEAAPRKNFRVGRAAMAVTAALLVAAVMLGNAWWKSEAASYAGYVYKPLQMTAALQGSELDLKLKDPGWLKARKLDDFIPDHDHLMHLYMIRWPEMDAVFHLHPEQTGAGQFRLQLPNVPAGDYRLYADVVHAAGFPETVAGDVKLPAIAGRALSGDDAAGVATPVEQSVGEQGAGAQRFALPDGYTMVWKRPAALVTKHPESFAFELLDRAAKPASDMSLYMGMPGHAAFVKTDGRVFAHIHPNGTMAMAAYMMANGESGKAAANMADMPGMKMDAAAPSTVSFPYGFPTAGKYRIFVQMKHGSTVETGVFDADVAEHGGVLAR
jgi:hypothetical protein